MAVTFTPNIGLAKPDNTEIARNWASGSVPELSEDNRIAFQAAIPNDVTYVVSLTAETAPPSVGSGTNATEYGRYVQLPGKFIMGWFVFRFDDPGVSAGNGIYGVSLPLPIDQAFHTFTTSFNSLSGQFDVVGEAFLRDNSVIGNSMTCALDLMHISGVSYVRFNTEAYTGKTNRFVTNTAPFAVADEDRIAGNFFYKAA